MADDTVIDMIEVVEAVARKGYTARVERTGGNCATIFAGPTHRDADGQERYAVAAGPGNADEWRASTAEFSIGGDDDESVASLVVKTNDAETIAVLIVAAIHADVVDRATR